MADNADHKEEGLQAPFRRFYYRGKEVHTLLDLSMKELLQNFHARARRRYMRGHVSKHLLNRLRKAKKAVKDETEKPAIVKTHLRNAIIVPEMLASQLGVYTGLGYSLVEIKPNMIGHYLGEFAITYHPVEHGRPGVGATNAAKFVPLK